MTSADWITIVIVVLSGLGSLAALVVSALVTALWAFARMRDKETQDKLGHVAGRVAQLDTATSRLEERTDAAESMMADVRATLTRLEAAVQAIAVSVAGQNRPSSRR